MLHARRFSWKFINASHARGMCACVCEDSRARRRVVCEVTSYVNRAIRYLINNHRASLNLTDQSGCRWIAVSSIFINQSLDPFSLQNHRTSSRNGERNRDRANSTQLSRISLTKSISNDVTYYGSSVIALIKYLELDTAAFEIRPISESF